MRVLIFGDSITQGFWDIDGGWAGRLRKYYDEIQLRDLDKDMPTIFNLSIDGNTSQDILQRIESETRARIWRENLPIVIVQIGNNDSLIENNAPWIPIDNYRANLVAIIEKLRPISSQIIFVGLSACDDAKTMPVAWGGYYYSNVRIKSYEDQMRAVAEAQNIPFIPVFDPFVEEIKSGQGLLSDGLHPNGKGHQVIFDIVQPGLRSFLEGTEDLLRRTKRQYD